MKIEFELKKPDYDKIVFKTIHGMIWIVLIGIVLSMPSLIMGEPIYIPFTKWMDGGIPAMWLVYVASAMITTVMYLIVALLLWLLVKLVATLIYSIQEIGRAYYRYDKKLWMENRDNEGKCINCGHNHKIGRSHYCLHRKNHSVCSCDNYEPLKVRIDGAAEHRYCVDCGIIFEANPMDTDNKCEQCIAKETLKLVSDAKSDMANQLSKVDPLYREKLSWSRKDNTLINPVPYTRSGYKATPSLKKETHECLLVNSWKPPLPPDYTQDDHNNQLMCICDDKWGRHTEKGICTRCDCEYFIEQKEKEYLNCPGCGEKGITAQHLNLDKDELRCSLLNSECKIWTWNKYTHEVTYESE